MIFPYKLNNLINLPKEILAAIAQPVEHQFPKLKVAGSSPVCRSCYFKFYSNFCSNNKTARKFLAVFCFDIFYATIIFPELCSFLLAFRAPPNPRGLLPMLFYHQIQYCPILDECHFQDLTGWACLSIHFFLQGFLPIL